MTRTFYHLVDRRNAHGSPLYTLMYLEHYTKVKGISLADIDVAPVVVMSWSEGVNRAMSEKAGAEPVPFWLWYRRYPFYTGSIQGQQVSFAQVGIGTPATITSMEELIACGARVFIGLGWAGSLHPRVKNRDRKSRRNRLPYPGKQRILQFFIVTDR